MKGEIDMLTTIKVFIMKALCNHYLSMNAYYMDNVIVCCMSGKFDEADLYQELAAMYLEKYVNMMSKFMRLAW